MAQTKEQKLSSHAKTQPRRKGKFAERPSRQASVPPASPVNLAGGQQAKPLPANKIASLITGFPDAEELRIKRTAEGTEYSVATSQMCLTILDPASPTNPQKHQTDIDIVVDKKAFTKAARAHKSVLEWDDQQEATALYLGADTHIPHQDTPEYIKNKSDPNLVTESCWAAQPPTLEQWENWITPIQFASKTAYRPLLQSAIITSDDNEPQGKMMVTDSYSAGISTSPVPLTDVRAIIPTPALASFTKAARRLVGSKNQPVVEFGAATREKTIEELTESEKEWREKYPKPPHLQGNPGVVSLKCGNVTLQAVAMKADFPNIDNLIRGEYLEACSMNPEAAAWVAESPAIKQRIGIVALQKDDSGAFKLVSRYQNPPIPYQPDSYAKQTTSEGISTTQSEHDITMCCLDAQRFQQGLKAFPKNTEIAFHFPSEAQTNLSARSHAPGQLMKPLVMTEKGKGINDHGFRLIQMPTRVDRF